MATPSSLVQELGHLVAALAASPGIAVEHTASAAELASLLAGTSALLSADGFGLTVSGHQLPAGAPGAEPLLAAMHRHHVGKVELAPGVPATAVLALARALAQPAEDDTSSEALASRIGLRAGGPIRLHPPPALPLASDTITLDRLGPGSGPADHAADPDELYRDLELPTEGVMRSAPGPLDAAIERSPSPFLQVTLAEALARLEADPADDDTGPLLHHVTQLGRQLVEREQWHDLLATGVTLLRAGVRAPDDMAPRFESAVRRLLTRPALEALVPLVVTGPYRAEGFAMYRRGGPDATDLLLERLVESEDTNERGAVFRALQEMTEGTGAIVRLLDHEQWYVLRNVAELCGLMGLESAAPRLQPLLTHPDERVRRAAAGAMARLPGPDAGEGVRTALRDRDPMVRLEVARALGGPASRGLAMTVAVLLAEEEHPDVLRELHLALGRIGTPEAVQALGKAAEPGGVLRGRKPQAVRLAAIEGLRVAGGPVAQRMLLALAADPDRDVGAAASAAVDAMPG